MRTKGSAEELERRRRLAVQRVLEGMSKVAVAKFLGVHPTSVRAWWKAYKKRGFAGLAPKPPSGRPPKLTARQERQVLNWLRKNPTSFGFATELWTAARVAQVIERKLNVRFHPRYLNAWLTARSITPQKPRTQPRERDDDAIARWRRHTWPRIENAHAS